VRNERASDEAHLVRGRAAAAVCAAHERVAALVQVAVRLRQQLRQRGRRLRGLRAPSDSDGQ
jgi:hypothetical protein